MTNLPALILAAGRGERMRPLTDHTPKPLLAVHGRPLIEWHLLALARDGVRDVVINLAWLGEQIAAALGDGTRYGLRIRYSDEARDHGGALETAGGIVKALPALGEAFWVLAGDVYMPGFRFDAPRAQRFTEGQDLANLTLVPNPPQHPQGDFVLDAHGRVHERSAAAPTLTYSTVGLYRAALFNGLPVGQRLPLRPLLAQAMQQGLVGGCRYDGAWADVGTPQRLQALDDTPATD